MWDLEDVLLQAQTRHAAMYLWTPSSIESYQKRWAMTNIVLRTPGWQVSSEE